MEKEVFRDNNRRKMTAWKTKTEITEKQWEEIKETREFHPQEMFENITKGADGTVYFNRAKAVQSKEQEQQFYYILKSEYVSPWRDIENITAYFEIVGNEIAAGAYNIITGEKISRRILISTDAERGLYVYNSTEIEKFKSMLNM